MNNAYTVINSEGGLWTVGTETDAGWVPVSDHSDYWQAITEAERRNAPATARRVDALEQQVAELQERVRSLMKSFDD